MGARLLAASSSFNFFTALKIWRPAATASRAMIRTGVAHAKNRHETVAQIFIDHAAMFLLDHAHGDSEKIVHHFHNIVRRARPSPPRPPPHIPKHYLDPSF